MRRILNFFLISCLAFSGIKAQQPISPADIHRGIQPVKSSNPAALKIYNLQECLETGLQNNYSILISRNEEQIAKNNATLGNAGYLPTIDFSSGYTGNLQDTHTTYRGNEEVTKDRGYYDQTVSAGVNLNWTIFEGFKIATTYERLKELEKLGELNTRITVENLLADLTAEYYNFIQQKIRLNNFRYAVSLSKERLRIVEERYNIGSFSRLDLQQARVDFNADSAQYMKQQELLITSRIRLNELMAIRDVDQNFNVVDSVIDVNETLIYDDLLRNTLRTNASLIRADQNRRLANLDLKLVTSRNYPYLRFNTGYGYTFNRYDISSTEKRHHLGLNVGVTVGINIFDGNRRRERKNALIEIDNSQLERRELEQALRADLSTLWQSYLNNIEMLKLERQNIVSAKENLEIAMERYLLGDLSGIEMREAQKSLLDAEERILTAEYNTKLCEISLLQISGKIVNYMN